MTLQKSFGRIRQQLLGVVVAFLRVVFQRDRRYFYGRYFGSDHPIIIGVKNIVRPSRLLKKFRYGQLVPLPRVLSRAIPVDGPVSLAPEWRAYLAVLERDGIVFVPGFFKRNAEVLCQRYRTNRQVFPASDEYKRFCIDLNDPDIFQIATDPSLLSVLAEYYGCQPYLRQLPAINCTHPGSEKARESIGYNNYWHYDTANQTTAHILLNDVSASDSCMFYAKGSHRTHRVQLTSLDYYYSEEYVQAHYEVVPCVGAAGTLIVFDPNGLHRVDLKPGTFRAHLHLNFIPGNDVIESKADVPSGFAPRPRADLMSLAPIQRWSLAHVSKTEPGE